jgi:alginate O-acetyltransferase complex protein AlgJ
MSRRIQPCTRRVVALGVALSMGLLLLPGAALLLGRGHEVSLIERRRLAPLPPLPRNVSAWGAYPRALEAYFDDHLGFRDDAITWNAWLRVRVFGVSPTRKVIVGKQGWLFFGDRHAVNQYWGRAHFDAQGLERWRSVLEERRRWLAARGSAYLLVIAPEKQTIYPEFMPDAIPRGAPPSQTDQLVADLRARSDLDVLDLREVLLAEKRRHQVYHRTDSHWNDTGAYAAYRAILERLRSTLPVLTAASAVPLARRTVRGQGRELAQILGLAPYLPETWVELSPREARARRASTLLRPNATPEESLAEAWAVADPRLPRAVVFRDSFSNALIPFLSEHFSRVWYEWSTDVIPEVVERERPDVVIQELVERNLGQPPHGLDEARRSRRTPGGAR